MTPQRIQMTRRPGGWRHEHPDAARIDRATRWGNPFAIERVTCPGGFGFCWTVSDGRVSRVHIDDQRTARAVAVELYEEHLARSPQLVADIRTELAGRDVACWCAADSPCHADVLLRVAAGGDP